MEKLKKEKKTVVSSWIPESAIKKVAKISRKRKKSISFIVSELILESLERRENGGN